MLARLGVSRPRWWGLALTIVMLGVANTQRAGAQWHPVALPGLRFGPPLRAGVALGVMYGNRTAAAEFAGPVVIGEFGLGGARASTGVVFAAPFASGLEILGSAIRTWGYPSQVDPNRTLVGGEMRVFFFAVNVGVGVFRPVAGFEGDRRTRYYLNFGLGV